MRWARSLIEIANVPPEDLVVHYTQGLGQDCAASFSPLGVRTTEVQAVSRQRPHLNKLAQLRSEFLRDADLAVLCDCDTLFVADPRPYFAKNMVAAVVVDSPNPPIEIWDILLRRAGLTRRRPDIAVGSAAAMTIFENRNGGLYVCPVRGLANSTSLGANGLSGSRRRRMFLASTRFTSIRSRSR